MKGALAAGLVVLMLRASSALAWEVPWSSLLRGWSVRIGGGVEGYTHALAPRVEPGVTYGVALGLQPTRVLGLEVGYSGAVNGLEPRGPGSAGGDVELVRHGAYAAASVGLVTSAVHPYVLGGLGFSSYNVRGAVSGFGDTTIGNIPLGAGVRTSLGRLSADVRLEYDVLFDQHFLAGTPAPDAGNVSHLTVSREGRYSGTLHLGVKW